MKSVHTLLTVWCCLLVTQSTVAQTTQLYKGDVIYYNDLEESGVVAVFNKDESLLKPGSYELTVSSDEQMLFSIDDKGNIAGELTYWANKGYSDEIKVVADFDNGVASQITVYNDVEREITYVVYKNRKPFYVKYTRDGKIHQEMQEDPETRSGFIKEYRDGKLKEEEHIGEAGNTTRNKYAPNGHLIRSIAYQKESSRETSYYAETGKKESEDIVEQDRRIRREYDEWGTLIFESVKYKDFPIHENTTQTFNAEGKLIKSSIEQKDVILETFYNENGAVTKTNTVTKLPGKKQDETPIEYVLGGDEYMDDGKVMQSVIKEPADYPRGIAAFQKYVQINFRFPAQAKEKGISGLAKVQFIVDENGEITDVEAVSNLGYGIEEELIRVVKSHKKKWIPAKDVAGNPVASPFNLPLKLSVH